MSSKQNNYPRGDRSLLPMAWSFSLLKCRISYTQCGEGGPVARHVTLWRNSGVNIWNKYHTTTHHIPAATCWPNFSGGSLCVILFLFVWNVLISFLPTSSSLWLAAAKQSAELLNLKIDTFGKPQRQRSKKRYCPLSYPQVVSANGSLQSSWIFKNASHFLKMSRLSSSGCIDAKIEEL